MCFGPLLEIDLVGYKGFSLISLGDKPSLGDGYAKVLHAACMARQARDVLVASRRGQFNYSLLE